jgi:hypothetical protein
MSQMNVRFAKSEDARGILEAHYSAVQVESNYELRAVYVAAEFGNQGVGSALLRELERAATKWPV